MEQMNSIRGNTRFLNVDLELVATLDVGPLLAHWAGDIVVLRDSIEGGRRTIWAELPDCPQDADSGIGELARRVEAPPGRLRELWDSCEDRCFNVGIQGGHVPHATAFPISARTIAALDAISARLEFTVYGYDDSAESSRLRDTPP
jgi:hypothetical protein